MLELDPICFSQARLFHTTPAEKPTVLLVMPPASLSKYQAILPESPLSRRRVKPVPEWGVSKNPGIMAQPMTTCVAGCACLYVYSSQTSSIYILEYIYNQTKQPKHSTFFLSGFPTFPFVCLSQLSNNSIVSPPIPFVVGHTTGT